MVARIGRLRPATGSSDFFRTPVMAGPAPKTSNRQRSHQGEARPVVVSIAARPRLGPDPPAGMLGPTIVQWSELWTSPIAATFVPSDVPALARLFRLRDERERAWRVAR